MNQVKATAIEGDVTVGRDTAMGGDATVQGNATIKKNLKVEGWLDAPNIKGHNKGHFKTEASLLETHPTPEDGWCALVGASLPAAIYLAINGEWNASGENGGVPMLDSESYNATLAEAKENIASIASDVTELQQNAATKEELATEVLERGTAIETITADLNAFSNQLTLLKVNINKLDTGKAEAVDFERVSTTATTALNSATVATQSVNAALSTATEAKETANAMSSRVTALENRSPFEELASEAEWQARKAAGTLDPNKLYFVAEQ